jgi:hypothetical protein
MSTTTPHGSPRFPTIEGTIQASTQDAMNDAVQTLQSHKDAWVACSVGERILLLNRLIKDFTSIATQWVAVSCQHKGITQDGPFAGEEWTAGPLTLIRCLCQLRQSLIDIEAFGKPRIPGPVTTRSNGQVVAQVFPFNFYDRLFYPGVTAEVWMEPGVNAQTLPETQALIYQDKQRTGKVALVLGAGNVSSIGPMDVLHKLFLEDQVVLLKMNPVNAYLGPLIERVFSALIERGFLRVCYGGAKEGAYLCNHPGIEEIHITGSDKSFDAIVFGEGAQGAARKAAKEPVQDRRVTGELGCVSPLIVVPGPWQATDIAYHAAHIATTLTNNAGFNCIATRMIIQHAAWDQRRALLQQIRQVLAQTPTRDAYYPGALELQRAFVAAHPEAELIGSASGRQLAWTLIPNVDPAATEDICYNTEAFCALFATTELNAPSVAEYIERAVEIANEQLWGTLSATLLVHPASLHEQEVAEALEHAVARLRYGTIGINYWAGAGFALGITPWGAFPGHTIYDIQSGTGFVHNTLMFSHSQKSVLRAPFRSRPTPSWFVTRHKAALKVFPRIVAFEAAPSPWKLPGIVASI